MNGLRIEVEKPQKHTANNLIKPPRLNFRAVQGDQLVFRAEAGKEVRIGQGIKHEGLLQIARGQQIFEISMSSKRAELLAGWLTRVYIPWAKKEAI